MIKELRDNEKKRILMYVFSLSEQAFLKDFLNGKI